MGKSRFRLPLFGMSALMVLVLLSACGNTTTGNGGSTPTSTTTLQVGLVTDIGGLNDRGFNQLAHTGYEQAEAKYHFKDSIIETTNTSDYIKNLTTAAQNNDMVVGVGFLMAQAIDQVAKTFPNKMFALVDSCAAIDSNGTCDTGIKNVVPLLFKEQQAGCLVGVVAGQMEKDGKTAAPKLLGANTIGAVGGIPVPAVERYIAGYKYCAAQVDPSVHVAVNYSQDFTDTSKCQDKANALITQAKADIIFQVAGGCGIGALNAAETAGVYGIGVDTDQGYIHPDSIITSAEKRVDVAVDTIIEAAEQGKYPSAPLSYPQFDINNNGVTAAPLSSAVPADVQPVVNQYISMIKSGSINIPTSCAPAADCSSS
jgi:basic membrane protein A